MSFPTSRIKTRREFVRRHAKAPSAGSPPVFATFSSLLRARGSGAPSLRLRSAPLLALAALLLAAAALAPALATAATVPTHLQAFSFDGSATPAGSFAGPERMAIDQGAGSLYVLDAGNGVIDKFDLSGTPQSFSALGSAALDGAGGGDCAGTPADCDETPQNGLGLSGDADIAVDNSGGASDGHIYVASEDGHLYAFDQTGAFLYQLDGEDTPSASLDNPCGVAVGGDGSIYVAGYFAEAVRKYTPSGGSASYDSEIPVGASSCHIAIDSSDNLYVAHYSDYVEKFDATGASQGTIDAGPAFALAVDPSNDRLYVDRGSSIVEHAADGSELDRFGSAQLSESRGLAVDGASSDVFASDSAAHLVHVFEPGTATVPDVAISPATDITSDSATLNGSVDPLGVPTSYRFEYRLQGSEDPWEATAEEDAGSSPGAQDVSAAISGLDPHTAYEARLSATNTEIEKSSTSAVDIFTTAAVVPTIGYNASAASESEATLSGWVNPHNDATTYHFEYGLADCSSNPCTPMPDQVAASGDKPLFVSQTIDGLNADTTYHYRLLAGNSAGNVEGSDRTFITETGLPDNRAWELVSPPDKNGADVMGDTGRTRAASDGAAVQFSSLTAFGDVVGTGIATEYLARRTAASGTNGWATHSITPEQEPLQVNFEVIFNALDPRYMGEFSPDLSKGVFLAHSPLGSGAGDVAEVPNLYLRRDLLEAGPGTYELLSDCPVCAGVALTWDPSQQPGLAGASADFGHVAFESRQNLVSGATGALPKLYEWDHGTLRLAGVLPDGSVAASSAAGQGAGANAALGRRYVGNVISADGSRIFFTSDVDSTSRGTESSRLYVRIDHATTVEIQRSERTDCADDPDCGGDGVPDLAPDPAGTQPALFDSASADGKTAFFISPEQLTDAPAAGLYRYRESADPDTDPHNLTLLAPDATEVIGVSDDGSYVYFIGGTQLADGLPDCSFEPCVFVWHDGVIHSVGSINGIEAQFAGFGASWSLARKWTRVTPDGRHLVFLSEGTDGLIGYDHGDACPASPNGSSSLACIEVYVYDATADAGQGRLSCASCNPSGAPATADALFNARTGTGGTGTTGHLNRAVSDDGRYVFFTSAERLVPQDRNGTVKDVYEYDTQTHQIRLISSGTGTESSYFMDASSSGDDVFFITRQQLVGWDTDNQIDLYDARVGGCFPEPPPLPEPCAGDACRGPRPGTPAFATPSSGSLLGAGNGRSAKRARKCKKGRLRRVVHHKVRCVKRRSPHATSRRRVR
jgi:WD40-like Beta Propeller Repeat